VAGAVVFVIPEQREDADYQLNDRENQTYCVKNIHCLTSFRRLWLTAVSRAEPLTYTLTYAHLTTENGAWEDGFRQYFSKGAAMKITIINFSGRTDGNCHSIAKVIRQVLSSGNEITLMESCHLNIAPCGNCGYSCFDEAPICPYAGDAIFGLYSSICASDLAFFIVPNYCDYPNSGFFIFNERSQSFFPKDSDDLYNQYLRVNKKFIVVSNTERDNFTRVFQYHVEDNAKPDVLFLSAKEFGKVSIQGDLMNSALARLAVEAFLR